MSRQTWDAYFCSVAKVVATRSTCPRLSVGAVLVKDRRIVSTGYNGSGSGQPHCIDKGCLVHDGHCRRPIHAEHNAIIQLAKVGNNDGAAYSTMYLTHSPCLDCFKVMYQAGIKRIVYAEEYKLVNYQELLDINNNMMPEIVKLPVDI